MLAILGFWFLCERRIEAWKWPWYCYGIWGGFMFLWVCWAWDYLSEILDVKVNPVMKSTLKPAIGKYTFEKVVADEWILCKSSSFALIQFLRFVLSVRHRELKDEDFLLSYFSDPWCICYGLNLWSVSSYYQCSGFPSCFLTKMLIGVSGNYLCVHIKFFYTSSTTFNITSF